MEILEGEKRGPISSYVNSLGGTRRVVKNSLYRLATGMRLEKHQREIPAKSIIYIYIELLAVRLHHSG